MAYIKGYSYDIFISYAHLDNEKLSGQMLGWIEQFYTDLNILLSRRIGKAGAIEIWWDNKKLDGNILFDESIKTGIKQSAILLCLTTAGYRESEYCLKELELFYKKAQKEDIGLSVGGRSRILNVLLNNIPFTQWPVELSGTTGFHFHDEVSEDDLGDPLDTGCREFKSRLQDLRDALIKLVNEFPKEEEPEEHEFHLDEEKKEDEFTIYFGDVADSLRTVKKRTITELKKRGYKIICDVPPPFKSDEHEKAVKEKLEEASMAVHLLDLLPGREIEDEESIWYPQKQAALTLELDKPQLIWVPAEIDIKVIDVEQYKTFMQAMENGKPGSKKIEYIRGTKSELAQQITDLAEQVKKQHLPPDDKVSVLLDTHYTDQIYALEVSKSLLEHKIQHLINPQEDDPRKNIDVLAERISKVSTLVFFYGKVTRDWVLERMSAALQLIVTNNYAVEDFFVFMVPPHKDPKDISLKQRFLKVNVVNNSDTAQIDTNALQQFLKNLRPVE